LVRSFQHQEVVHERAQYYLETGRRLNPGLRLEIPHMGAVVALENEEQRDSSDIFPSFVMLNPGFYFLSNNGFLSSRFAPFKITDPTTGIINLAPLDGLAAFERRRATFQLLDGIGETQEGSPQQQVSINQEQAEKLM